MAPRRVKERGLARPLQPALQQRAVDEFWRRTQEDIEATVDFSGHLLPMSRVKSILRDEQGDMMISADTPAYVTKLTELFIQELAVRAWACAQTHHRRIILDTDIAEAVASTKSYGFLDGLVARYFEEQRGVGHASSTPPRARLITRKRHTPAPSRHPQNTVVNADPDEIATAKLMEKTTVNHCSVEVEKQDGAGGDKPSMYSYMEEILMDEEDMLYLDDEFDLVSTPTGLEDFIGDNDDVLDGDSGCN